MFQILLKLLATSGTAISETNAQVKMNMIYVKIALKINQAIASLNNFPILIF